MSRLYFIVCGLKAMNLVKSRVTTNLKYNIKNDVNYILSGILNKRYFSGWEAEIEAVGGLVHEPLP